MKLRNKKTGEIKFRAWDKKRKKMFVAQSINRSGCATVLLKNQDILILPKKQIEIMQYTGLKDKNDKEIYEGDIVEFGLLGRERRGYVSYSDDYASFEIYSKRDVIFVGLFGHAGKVIGNIYENPELMEGEK